MARKMHKSPSGWRPCAAVRRACLYSNDAEYNHVVLDNQELYKLDELTLAEEYNDIAPSQERELKYLRTKGVLQLKKLETEEFIKEMKHDKKYFKDVEKFAQDIGIKIPALTAEEEKYVNRPIHLKARGARKAEVQSQKLLDNIHAGLRLAEEERYRL